MNLIGHVAVAIDPATGAAPSTGFLVGCMLPDLAAIARVRVTRPSGDLGRGVEFHHACDAVFHGSAWFRDVNREVRDALVDAGVPSGAARACSHAGVEMLLDGALVSDPPIAHHARVTLGAVDTGADELGVLAPPEVRGEWVARLHVIGATLDPDGYRDAHLVAARLQRMTSGRRRIELPVDHVAAVATTLDTFIGRIGAAAPSVMTMVSREVPSHLRPV